MSGMSKKSARRERRFRSGAWLLILVAAVGAGSVAALFHDMRHPVFYASSLALPVVTDIAIEAFFSGWIWMEKVRYYWFVGSLIMAGLLAVIGMLCLTISFSGSAFSGSFPRRHLGRFFRALGTAQLLSARALSAFGILFYLLDVLLSAVLVFAFPQTFTPLYLSLMANLFIHLLVLSFLGYAFSAAVGGRDPDGLAEKAPDGDGTPRR